MQDVVLLGERLWRTGLCVQDEAESWSGGLPSLERLERSVRASEELLVWSLVTTAWNEDGSNH